MTIKEFYVKTSPNGTPAMAVEIWYKASETLPNGYAEGSVAYCYDGADKGKVYIYDGSAWVEQ